MHACHWLFSLMNPILSVANGLIIFVLLPLEIETGHHRIAS